MQVSTQLRNGPFQLVVAFWQTVKCLYIPMILMYFGVRHGIRPIYVSQHFLYTFDSVDNFFEVAYLRI